MREEAETETERGRGMREEAETERERRRRMRKEGDQKNPIRGGIFIGRNNTPP